MKSFREKYLISTLVFILLIGLSLVSVETVSAKLLVVTTEAFIRNSTTIIIGEIVRVKAPVGNFNPVVLTVEEVLKGMLTGTTVEVNFSLTPPCLPDRIEGLPRKYRPGYRCIVCLKGAPGSFTINDYWGGSGIVVFSEEEKNRYQDMIRQYDLTLLTEKSSYGIGEKVQVTITNNSGFPVFSHFASGTPGAGISSVEREIGGGHWQPVPIEPPDIMYDIDAPGEVKNGEAISYQWSSRQWTKDGYIPLLAGAYRLKHLYQRQRGGEWIIQYSNVFEISE